MTPNHSPKILGAFLVLLCLLLTCAPAGAAQGPVGPAQGPATPAQGAWDPVFTPPNSLGKGSAVSMALNGDDMYLGGSFIAAGTSSSRFITRWSPASGAWAEVGGGAGDIVTSIINDGQGHLYVGGYFERVGSLVTSWIAQYTLATDTWARLGTGLDGLHAEGTYAVGDIAIDAAGRVYAVGNFQKAGGAPSAGFARYDPATGTWTDLAHFFACTAPSCVKAFYRVAADHLGNVYVGGNFDGSVGMWNHVTDSWSVITGNAAVTGVRDLAIDGQDRLLLAADVVTIAGADAHHVARYNPADKTWSPLGKGIPSATGAKYVATLAPGPSGRIYAGGSFTRVDGAPGDQVAVWDETAHTWSGLHGELSDPTTDATASMLGLDASGRMLLVGGSFSHAGGVDAVGLAEYNLDAQQWAAPGKLGGRTAAVNALAAAPDSSEIYMGGSFLAASGRAAVNLAAYNPASNAWSGMDGGVIGSSVQNPVRALAVDGSGRVYVGGSFKSAGTVAAKNVARWDPATHTWSALGSGSTDGIASLALDSTGNLYTGAYTDTFASTGTMPVRRWDVDGETWEDIGQAKITGCFVDCGVMSLAAGKDGHIYAAGPFQSMSGVAALGVAEYDPARKTWAAMGDGLSGAVTLLVDSSGTLYAGGGFVKSGQKDVTRVARWDPAARTWNGLGTWSTGTVYALTEGPGGLIYAGGAFDSAGGMPAKGIAAWNGAAWEALGSGVTSRTGKGESVRALWASPSGSIYVGGKYFVQAGGLPVTSLARWGQGAAVRRSVYLPALNR